MLSDSEIPPYTGNFEEFENYLQQKKLRESTIHGHLQDLKRFQKWCKKTENINYTHANYNQLLKFIQQTKERGVSKSSINIHLNSIGKYYDYLVTTGERTDNPARELRVKKDGKKVLQNLLKPEELEEIYQTYSNKPQWTFRGERTKQSHQRNIVILGLLLFQGVHTGELKKIEKTQINLNKGSIYIPGTGRSNSRILKLNAQQILSIQHYLSTQKKEDDKLFFIHMKTALMCLLSILKKMDTRVKDANQLRSSVIVNWLKQHNIRQVQYMAGHRHISSTERYKQEDLQDLQKQLELFHPFQ